jgi:hypothetical protein
VAPAAALVGRLRREFEAARARLQRLPQYA